MALGSDHCRYLADMETLELVKTVDRERQLGDTGESVGRIGKPFIPYVRVWIKTIPAYSEPRGACWGPGRHLTSEELWNAAHQPEDYRGGLGSDVTLLRVVCAEHAMMPWSYAPGTVAEELDRWVEQSRGCTEALRQAATTTLAFVKDWS